MSINVHEWVKGIFVGIRGGFIVISAKFLMKNGASCYKG